jgi:putative Holliday junction resolvase
VKYIGIDYGSKRIGVALSDEGGAIAFPFSILPNSKNVIAEIQILVSKEAVGAIVMGESFDQNGVANKINSEIQKFAKELEALNLPIHFEKEFMTSHHASGQHGIGKKMHNARQTKSVAPEPIDSSAVALILQRYLDRLNNHGKINL